MPRKIDTVLGSDVGDGQVELGAAVEVAPRPRALLDGVILYELTTSDLPFDVRARPAAEALRIVLDRDPTPPATRSRAFRGDALRAALRWRP